MNKSTSIPGQVLSVETVYEGQPRSRPYSAQEETPEFVEYWRAVMLRKWRILAVGALIAALTYFALAYVVPVYRSTVTVLIETDIPRLVPVGDVYNPGGSNYREYFQTQAEVLKSRAIAQRVVAKLKLDEHPEFDPSQRKPSGFEKVLRTYLPTLAAALWDDVPGSEQSSKEAAVLKKFAEQLVVEPVRLTQLIKIGFEAKDPKLAAAVANATAEAYVQADLDARYKKSDKTEQLIDQQLTDLKTKLDASELALQTYRDKEGMLDSKSTVLGGTGKQLDELSQKLVEARIRRSEAEQAYRQVKAAEITNYDTIPAVVKSSSVQRARELEAEAEKRVAEISQRYGPDHPNFAAARSDLIATRAVTERQIQNLVTSIAREYKAARATEKTIEESLAQAKGAIQNLNRKEIPLEALEREAAGNRQLYQAFLSSSKETSASKDAQASIARIVDPAAAALLPIRPAKARTVVVGALAGLLIGVIATLLRTVFSDTVRTSKDVEVKLQQRFLAAVPLLSRKERKNSARAVLHHPQEQFAESIRTALNGVLLTQLNSPPKIIVVTSSAPGEGKSTFAMNLAISKAKSKRVLLVEGDMRRPYFAKAMNLPRGQKGLSELLSGSCTFDQALVRIEGSDLHIIPAGEVPANPLDLLASQKFHDLLAMLRDRCDMVIIDTPPVQVFSDAFVIGSQASGVIFVVKADDTPAELARNSLKQIHSVNIPIFGVVLNQQDFIKAEKYHGEYTGYGRYGSAYATDAGGLGLFRKMRLGQSTGPAPRLTHRDKA